jgi:hypothetical protein
MLSCFLFTFPVFENNSTSYSTTIFLATFRGSHYLLGYVIISLFKIKHSSKTNKLLMQVCCASS